jgi:hypothetical protein
MELEFEKLQGIRSVGLFVGLRDEYAVISSVAKVFTSVEWFVGLAEPILTEGGLPTFTNLASYAAAQRRIYYAAFRALEESLEHPVRGMQSHPVLRATAWDRSPIFAAAIEDFESGEHGTYPRFDAPCVFLNENGWYFRTPTSGRLVTWNHQSRRLRVEAGDSFSPSRNALPELASELFSQGFRLSLRTA